MIPPILHQTWKTDRIPEQFQPWVESWKRHNPGWTRMFWNDRTLLEFVGQHYPDFLDTFCSYPSGIFRADAGRYLLLHHFGGVYADLSFPDQTGLIVHPPEPFAPLDREGKRDASALQRGVESLSVHHWAGTWLGQPDGRKLWRSVKKRFYRAKYLLTRGEQASPTELRSRVAPTIIQSPLPKGGNVAVLVPLRDAVEHIVPFLNVVGSLDYPSDRIKLVFCEGDTKDGSWERLQSAALPLREKYRDIVLLRKGLGTELDRVKRHKPRFQRERRGGLARVRNHLIEHGAR